MTSGNGDPSAGLYALRVQYLDEPKGPMAGVAPQQKADPGLIGASDALTDDTNTIYVMDTQRFGDTWGAAQAGAVRTALASLNGVNGVSGAVISVDGSETVRAARDFLDKDPCSMSARAGLTKEINRFVSQTLGDRKSQITSIVMIGGDDILPLAPVAEHIDLYSERSHASDLPHDDKPDGSACPTTVPENTVDPCATPIQAAAATSSILSDDPYGMATAYDTVGGTLYVPSVATGRLVEEPTQILATITRFRESDGVVQASSSLTGGYGAWAELPDLVTTNLQWRGGANTSLGDSWDKTRLAETLLTILNLRHIKFPSANGFERQSYMGGRIRHGMAPRSSTSGCELHGCHGVVTANPKTIGPRWSLFLVRQPRKEPVVRIRQGLRFNRCRMLYTLGRRIRRFFLLMLNWLMPPSRVTLTASLSSR